MRRVAEIISFVLNPIFLLVLLPSFILYRAPEDMELAMVWTLYTLAFLVLISCFLWYGVHKKFFTDFDVSKKEQRPLLFFVSFILLAIYLGGILLFSGPSILAVTAVCLLVGLIFVSVLNTKIKASMHLATLSAMVVPYVVVNKGWSVLLLSLIPVVAWSRITLKRHTRNEVIVGSIVGTVLSLSIYLLLNRFYD
jgi:PAP2 superfamily